MVKAAAVEAAAINATFEYAAIDKKARNHLTLSKQTQGTNAQANVNNRVNSLFDNLGYHSKIDQYQLTSNKHYEDYRAEEIGSSWAKSTTNAAADKAHSDNSGLSHEIKRNVEPVTNSVIGTSRAGGLDYCSHSYPAGKGVAGLSKVSG